jgi:hypothetical protein
MAHVPAHAARRARPPAASFASAIAVHALFVGLFVGGVVHAGWTPSPVDGATVTSAVAPVAAPRAGRVDRAHLIALADGPTPTHSGPDRRTGTP